VVKQLLLAQANVDIDNNVNSDNWDKLPSPLSAQSLVLDAHVRMELDGSPDWSVGGWVGVVGWYGWWLLYGKHVPGLCISNANGKV
jgi:hypothetical protein